MELPYEKKETAVQLPSPLELAVNKVDVREAIESRQSIREYKKEPVTLGELSYLLWCTQGIKEKVPEVYTLRNVPSAGARHALETYILINRVEGLSQGLYRFAAGKHQLFEYNIKNGIADQITRACLNQGFVKNSAVTFVWTAVPYRMKWRYGERGYRYLYLDAGHVCQNLYLSAQSINCGVCAIAAFDDDDMNQILNIDGEEQFVIYIATVGKK